MLENLRVYIFGILGCIYLLYNIIILLIFLYVLFIDNFWVKIMICICFDILL